MRVPVAGSFPGVAAEHEHTWELVQVEYADSGGVREYSCVECRAVWFD